MTAAKRRHMFQAVIGLCLVTCLVASTVYVQKYRYRAYLHDSLYLPSGEFIEQISLGYRQLVADIVWFSAVQYYGDFRKGRHDLAYFRGLIDIITRLDPHFTFAYVFGALVVSEDIGEFEAGTEILKMGMAKNPRSWKLPFEIGFLHYVNRVNYRLAARYFTLASRVEGAPEYTRRFAAFVNARAGFADSAIELWEAYREYTDDPYLKQLAEGYIEQLKRSPQSPEVGP